MSGAPHKGWGSCLDCGYEGMLEYSPLEGEDYSDPEAMGVVMILACPACGSRDHALVAIEYYREMVGSA